MDKFAGVGLVNIFVIWLVCCCLTVLAKSVFTLYEVEGVSEFIRTV